MSTSGWPAENPSQVSAVAAVAARRVSLRRYKTELCRWYAETGQSRYGVKCQFAHGADELRALARLLRRFTEADFARYVPTTMASIDYIQTVQRSVTR